MSRVHKEPTVGYTAWDRTVLESMVRLKAEGDLEGLRKAIADLPVPDSAAARRAAARRLERLRAQRAPEVMLERERMLADTRGFLLQRLAGPPPPQGLWRELGELPCRRMALRATLDVQPHEQIALWFFLGQEERGDESPWLRDGRNPWIPKYRERPDLPDWLKQRKDHRLNPEVHHLLYGTTQLFVDGARLFPTYGEILPETDRRWDLLNSRKETHDNWWDRAGVASARRYFERDVFERDVHNREVFRDYLDIFMPDGTTLEELRRLREKKYQWHYVEWCELAFYGINRLARFFAKAENRQWEVLRSEMWL